MEYVYKCVSKSSSRKMSSISPPERSLTLTYELGKRTSCLPNTPGIFVFKTLRSAKNFTLTCHIILKCTFRGEVFPLKWRFASCRYQAHALRRLFRKVKSRKKWAKDLNVSSRVFYQTGSRPLHHPSCGYYIKSSPAATHTVASVVPVEVVQE